MLSILFLCYNFYRRNSTTNKFWYTNTKRAGNKDSAGILCPHFYFFSTIKSVQHWNTFHKGKIVFSNFFKKIISQIVNVFSYVAFSFSRMFKPDVDIFFGILNEDRLHPTGKCVWFISHIKYLYLTKLSLPNIVSCSLPYNHLFLDASDSTYCFSFNLQ